MTSRHSFTRPVVDHTIEDAPVCDAASRIVSAIVTELCQCCSKRRRTVRADTCCLANDPHSWLRARNVAARSINAKRITCLSRELVIGAVEIQHGVPYYRPEPIEGLR
ncbi:hypothetical protein TNCV_3369501 [Trichonephila clavipes]|uniref:Uncharacterized protein n=1 Tax=Trichonephila clavipes TaxID=2585209 RepID=A0A8X6R8W1_TRICX|nr:hypothetical protein TNCV_3369501 [Trichonephila clavipes]